MVNESRYLAGQIANTVRRLVGGDDFTTGRGVLPATVDQLPQIIKSLRDLVDKYDAEIMRETEESGDKAPEGTVPITLNLSTDNEGAAAPWWVVVDPRQSMSADPHNICSMVDGPFFSRESAEKWMVANKHNYSKRAVVYCMSGHHSHEYRRACEKAGIR